MQHLNPTQNSLPIEANWTFTTRRVDRGHVVALSPHVEDAGAGDLLLCETAEVNQNKKVQLSNRRCKPNYPGDPIVVCVGDRYAPDQFQGRASISAESAGLLAGGGGVGTMESAHGRMAPPTRV